MSQTPNKTPKHFLDINELPLSELKRMLAASSAMKAKQKAQQPVRPLEGHRERCNWAGFRQRHGVECYGIG